MLVSALAAESLSMFVFHFNLVHGESSDDGPMLSVPIFLESLELLTVASDFFLSFGGFLGTSQT